MNIAQALVRAQTHTEIVHCEDTREAIDALVSEAEGSVDVVAQYGHVDVWGTDEDGGEWRLNVTPLPMFAPGDRVVSGGASGAEGVVQSVDGASVTVRWCGEDAEDSVDGEIETVREATLRAAEASDRAEAERAPDSSECEFHARGGSGPCNVCER